MRAGWEKGVMNIGRWECTFLWFIENYSYRCQENDQWVSPTFHVLEETAWELCLLRRGLGSESADIIALQLRRNANDAGPKVISVKYELSILAADGTAIYSEEYEKFYSQGCTDEAIQFLPVDEIRLQSKAEYLPNDTLSIRCKMWTGEGNVQVVQRTTARTRFIIEHISFLHFVKNFIDLKPNEKSTIEVRSQLKEERVLSCSVYYTDASCGEEKIMIEIVPSDAEHILRKCKVSTIDAIGTQEECSEINYRHKIPRINYYKFPLSFTRETILDQKLYYFNDDTLALLCECNFQTQIKCEKIEDLFLAVVKQESDHAHGNHILNKAAGKFSEYPSILEDIKAIYKNQRLTDVELKTKTKSFPAHKIVLASRSPVFEAMMTSAMKEKNPPCIGIDDLEDDIVEQLLLFLYSDNLNALQWKSATQLYYAAQKYQIEKLKAICSFFLAENLNISNASELLYLADIHNDSNLKKFVEDFVLKHEEQVFFSKEWEKLKVTNPQLVVDTMCLKYKRKMK